jgi:phosphatidate cytidylyltransferase
LFKQRVITALVLAPLALCAVFYLPPVGFAIFLASAFAVAAWEWASFCGWHTLSTKTAFTTLITTLYGAVYLVTPAALHWPVQTNYAVQSLLWLGVAWWLLAVLLVLSFRSTQHLWAQRRAIKVLMGVLTLVPSFTAILLVRQVNFEQSSFTGAWLICLMLGLVWAADIGGYVIGKPFGKHKLMPDVSPGKTLEGFAGGLMFVMMLVGTVAATQHWPEQTPLWFAAAAILTLLSVFGDLSESMFKRAAGLKDSGNIFPGHGGMLDRIDSLTATAPLFAIFVALFGGF